MSVTNLNQKKLSHLQYYILPGKPPTNFEHQELHDRAYCYWRDFWRKVFGDDESVLADDFIRQDFVPVVMLDTQIVAMHLYTVFNPESVATREHSYFKTYPPEFFDFLTKRNAKRVMSIESLTVDPNWRKSQVGISLGETLIGASLKYLDALDIDANIAPTRNDRGVNKMCYNFGFDCFRSKLDYKGFEIDLVSGFRNTVRPNPDHEINELIDQLWLNRIDLTGQIPIESEHKQTA